MLNFRGHPNLNRRDCNNKLIQALLHKNMKKLEFVKGPVVSYLHHAYPLGIIYQNPNAMGWISSSYIYMYCYKDLSFFNMLVGYKDNPFLRTSSISVPEWKRITLCMSLPDFIISLIDLDIYVEIIVDEYYLPIRPDYMKNHHMHQLLITGYDLENDNFTCWTFVNRIFQETTCKFAEVIPYQSDILYGDDTIMLLYTKRDRGFVFKSELIWEQLYDYVEGNNLYRKLAIWGDYDRYEDAVFGIECYEYVVKKLRKESFLDYIDFRCLNVVYEHKKCMSLRFKYINSINKGDDFFLTKERLLEFQSIEDMAEMIIKIALKYNLSESRKKKDEFLDRIIALIDEIRSKEINLFSDMIEQKEKSNMK